MAGELEKSVKKRKRHKPTPETRLIVSELYMAGISKERLAKRLSICVETLDSHYRDELENNKERKIAILATNLYQDALDGDKHAREFFLRTQGRWSFAKPHEDNEKDDKMGALLEKLIDRI